MSESTPHNHPDGRPFRRSIPSAIGITERGADVESFNVANCDSNHRAKCSTQSLTLDISHFSADLGTEFSPVTYPQCASYALSISGAVCWSQLSTFRDSQLLAF